jgi:phosphatidylglycerophosphate synthase
MSAAGGDERRGQETELGKAAREALARAALAAVALVIAVLVPVPMWAKILIFFTILFVAGIAMRARKVRGSS